MHLLHPVHRILLEQCQGRKSIGEMLMIDFKRLRATGALDQHQLKNNVAIELEKSQEYLKTIWYVNYVNIFIEKIKEYPVPNALLNSFYHSLSLLASNQVQKYTIKKQKNNFFLQIFYFFAKLKDLLVRTIFAWCDLLKPENHLSVPIIRMELTFDDQKMQFYPTINAINELLVSIVYKITEAIPPV